MMLLYLWRQFHVYASVSKRLRQHYTCVVKKFSPGLASPPAWTPAMVQPRGLGCSGTSSDLF